MNEATKVHAMLPQALPSCPHQRLLLFTLRRMAGAGLNDAMATHALLTGFRGSFRRPLVLLRAFVAEVSRASQRSLLIAPCCAHRITEGEAVLLEGITDANGAPRDAHARFCQLLDTPDCLGVLSSAQAVSQAFADLGKPLSPHAAAFRTG